MVGLCSCGIFVMFARGSLSTLDSIWPILSSTGPWFGVNFRASKNTEAVFDTGRDVDDLGALEDGFFPKKSIMDLFEVISEEGSIEPGTI